MVMQDMFVGIARQNVRVEANNNVVLNTVNQLFNKWL
jgi:hypothetical protein